MELYYYALIFAGIIGLCVGSFLNVVIYRVPNGMSIAKPDSHCPKCKNPIKWYDNIPVLSYLFLGGKCRHCKEKISIRYTIVEIVNALLWVLSVVMFWKQSIFFSILVALACSVLICVFFVDLEHMIIPDSFNIALLLIAIAGLFANFDKHNGWESKLLGFALAGGLFLVLHYGCIILLKKEGLGGGDVKLMAVCGMLLGATYSLIAILFASVIASLVLIFIKGVKHYSRDKEYPFAPFLVIGILLALFFGYYIYTGYMELIM